MIKQITKAQIANLTFELVKAPPASMEGLTRLNWEEPIKDRKPAFETSSDKHWMLDACTCAEFGRIEGNTYQLMNNSADSDSGDTYIDQYIAVTVPQNCEPDLSVLKGILDTLWLVAYDAYQLGYLDGEECTRIELGKDKL